MVSRRTLAKGTIGLPVMGSAAALALQGTGTSAQDLTVKVGSKDFTEQFILGQMYIKVLEDMGIGTEDHTNLGGTQIAQQALVSGEIDLYPEYTGTGLTEVLGLTVDDALGGGATPVAGAAAATPVIQRCVAGRLRPRSRHSTSSSSVWSGWSAPRPITPRLSP